MVEHEICLLQRFLLLLEFSDGLVVCIALYTYFCISPWKALEQCSTLGLFWTGM